MSKDNLHLEAHLGRRLPEEFQLPHELHANQFIDMVEEQIPLLYENVHGVALNMTQVEMHKGAEAEQALIEWNTPKYDGYRNDFVKEMMNEDVDTGKKADAESATQTRVDCSLYGDNEVTLEEASKKVQLFAAEKGGNQSSKKAEKNPLHGIRGRDVEGKLSDITTEYVLHQNFVFT